MNIDSLYLKTKEMEIKTHKVDMQTENKNKSNQI